MKFRRSSIRLIFFLIFILSYLLVGALVFSLIEGPQELIWIENLQTLRSAFLKENRCVQDDELEALIEEIIRANDRGVSALKNVTSEPNWSFGQSIFFAGTVLTTIGYGHVTPLSQGGKVFCIVYALIGIPLTLIMFTALVERLMILTNILLDWLTEKLSHIYKAFHIRLIHLSIILTFLLVFIFFIPAAIFMTLESNWNYLDAVYYCFISLTTIGLGDYIPGDQPEQPYRPLYKIITTFYLFFGLIMMMLTLANIYEVPELNIGFHFYMGSDEEKEEQQLLSPSSKRGSTYTEQIDEKSTTFTSDRESQAEYQSNATP